MTILAAHLECLGLDHIFAHRQRKTAPPGVPRPVGPHLGQLALASFSNRRLSAATSRFHLDYHLRQQFLALLLGVGIDVSGLFPPIGPLYSIPSVPSVALALGLAQIAAPPVPAFPSLWLEAGHCMADLCLGHICRWGLLGNALVDLHRRRFLHIVSNMGIAVQGRGAGYMAYNGGQGLDVHPLL